jgi:phage baseplate assembly protein V
VNADLIRAARRIMFAIGRGKVTLVDDSGPIQKHQVDMGPLGPNGSLAIRDNTAHAALFGVASNPPVGADAIVLFVGGDRSNGVVVATNHQAYRLRNLQPGDTALYDIRSGQTVILSAAGVTITDHLGQTVVLGASGITLTDISGDVLALGGGAAAVTTPEASVSGNLTVANGASGSFTTPTGQTVTVQDGVVTNIY